MTHSPLSVLRWQNLPIINICMALIGLYISLIISSLARHFETHSPPNGPRGCALFSAVLEYFSQVYLVWTMAEALVFLWNTSSSFSSSSYSARRVSNKMMVLVALVCWCKWGLLVWCP